MILDNALAYYYPQIQKSLAVLEDGDTPGEFQPSSELPPMSPELTEFFAPSALAHVRLPDYRGSALSMLDLRRNPGTQTTKTFASLVLVARAVNHIKTTGEKLTIFTPSSANKAVALRDAVLRALDLGLVRADELNIVCIVPSQSKHKLRDSRLSSDPSLRRRNPIAVLDTEHPGEVKTLARQTMEDLKSSSTTSIGTKIWYTLSLNNYLAADVVRALAESEFFPPSAQARLHVHAVSSAYGLLGHAFGRETFPEVMKGSPAHYLLVQHLGTPDMVAGLYDQPGWQSDEEIAGHYALQGQSHLYERHTQEPRLPARTFEPAEVLDPTFYTRNPVTLERMSALIHSQGGGGIIVSLAECLDRYGEIRALLRDTEIGLPANPTLVNEWSLVMAMTGVLNAIDRGLLSERDILVHGSGSYARGDYEVLGPRDVESVSNVEQMAAVVRIACNEAADVHS